MSPMLRDATRRLMCTAYQVAGQRADAPTPLIEQLRERAREVSVLGLETGAALPDDIQILVGAAKAVHRNPQSPRAFDLLGAAHAHCADALPRQAATERPEAPEAQPSFWWMKD